MSTPDVTSDSPKPSRDFFDDSDDALAADFSRKYLDLRYTAAFKKWYEWDGAGWKEDRTVRVFDHVRHYVRSLSAKSARLSEQLRSSGKIFAIERLARSDRKFAMVPEQWDANDWLLSTRGGIVDLRTGLIRPACKEDYTTKMTAVAPAGDCPLWHEFLNRVTDGDSEMILFMQRMLGYCLTGCVNEHALFYLYGSGGNGKSTFLETSRSILGSYSRPAPPGLLMASKHDRHTTDIAGLRGIRMAITTEVEEGRAWDTTRIKWLTGGDTISARLMRQDNFDFDPNFKLLISGNTLPGLSRVDDATRRRFNVLPFRVKIADPDRNFREKLRSEWPGILTWMIEGCLMWQQQGLCRPSSVTDATAKYIESQDTVGRWIAEECELKAGVEEPIAALYDSYSNWCSQNDEQLFSKTSLGDRLEERAEITRGTSGHAKTRVMIGIRLRPRNGRG